jgi:hypothetical protein
LVVADVEEGVVSEEVVVEDLIAVLLVDIASPADAILTLDSESKGSFTVVVVDEFPVCYMNRKG